MRGTSVRNVGACSHSLQTWAAEFKKLAAKNPENTNRAAELMTRACFHNGLMSDARLHLDALTETALSSRIVCIKSSPALKAKGPAALLSDGQKCFSCGKLSKDVKHCGACFRPRYCRYQQFLMLL